jgi:photosystem II stability/assembly factor-like uncharacterized protein
LQSGAAPGQQFGSPLSLVLVCGGNFWTPVEPVTQLFRSSDSGQHWSLVASASNRPGPGAMPNGEVTGLIVAGDGESWGTRVWLGVNWGVLTSGDGGRTWSYAFPVVPNLSTSVEITSLPGQTLAWATVDGVLWRTTDGVTWMRL